MRVSVVILYRLEKVDGTAVFVTVAAVRRIRKGKRSGRVHHFLLPAVFDFRNGYSPDVSERVYNTDEDTYWDSIFDFVRHRYKCTFEQTKLLLVKEQEIVNKD